MIFTTLAWLSIVSLVLALPPCLLFFRNLRAYLPPGEPPAAR